MPPNVDAMVREGIRAYRGGKKAEARTLLEKALEIDQYNEQAWLWLSAVAESPEDQRTCLENVLFINPDNKSARQGLQMLTGQTGEAPPAIQQPPSQQPVSSLPGAFSPPSTPAFTDSGIAGQADEWIPPTATSSPSSVFAPKNETTSEEYDQWVAGLKLGSSGADEIIPKPSQASSSSAFGNIEDILGDGFFDDEEVEEEEEIPPAPAKSQRTDMDDLREKLQGSTFPDEDEFANGPFMADLDLSDFEESEPARPVTKSSAPRVSPGAENVGKKTSSARIADDDMAQMSGAGLFVDPDADDYGAIDYDSNPLQDPVGFFQYIPKDISATRLPGTNEQNSPVVLAGMIVLILANLGAVGWLISNLLG